MPTQTESRMLICATDESTRVALVVNGKLTDYIDQTHNLDTRKDNIYKGKITRIEPSLGAFFVDYGCERNGFLPKKEVSPEYYLTQETDKNGQPDISRMLRVGQELVVQVDKEERGNKGAALTTYISLPGAFLVLMPNDPRAGGISRRIVDPEEREQTKTVLSQLNIPDGMGVIIRTAGLGKTIDQLAWDLHVLLNLWEAIKKAAVARPGPYPIHLGNDPITRPIRDYLRQHISEVIIDEPNAFERALNYIQQIRPDFAGSVKLYNDHLPLFSRFGIDSQIEAAYQREVRLPSGGSIVIDHTEALTSVDVNSSRSTRGGSIEETALNTNLEAADAVAMQLRLRDTGGLVVIDFIDMMENKHRRQVEERLQTATDPDRARIQLGRISRFGLLELSRQRLGASLKRVSQVPCPRCEGQGTIRSVESFALSMVNLIQEKAAKTEGTVTLQIQLPVDVSTYLLNEKRASLTQIEQHTQIQIQIIPNEHFESPHYHLRVVKEDPHSRVTPTYRLPQPRMTPTAPQRPQPSKRPSAEEPAITQFLTQPQPTPHIGERRKEGKEGGQSLIKRIWDIMFGNSEHDATSPKPSSALPTEKISPDTRAESSTRSTRERDRGTGAGAGAREDQTRPASAASESRGGRDRRRGSGSSRRRGRSGSGSSTNVKRDSTKDTEISPRSTGSDVSSRDEKLSSTAPTSRTEEIAKTGQTDRTKDLSSQSEQASSSTKSEVHTETGAQTASTESSSPRERTSGTQKSSSGRRTRRRSSSSATSSSTSTGPSTKPSAATKETISSKEETSSTKPTQKATPVKTDGNTSVKSSIVTNVETAATSPTTTQGIQNQSAAITTHAEAKQATDLKDTKSKPATTDSNVTKPKQATPSKTTVTPPKEQKAVQPEVQSTKESERLIDSSDKQSPEEKSPRATTFIEEEKSFGTITPPQKEKSSRVMEPTQSSPQDIRPLAKSLTESKSIPCSDTYRGLGYHATSHYQPLIRLHDKKTSRVD